MIDPEKLSSLPKTREEAFTSRYAQLLTWALRLTNQRRVAAEDLVQDAFIQFTRGRTSLDEIENVDAYLYRMLRNMNLSRLSRFAEQLQEKAISITEQEILQLDAQVVEIPQRLQSQELLERVCAYACARKETSRAGSVLILKSFFDYTPTEIAQVLCCSRHCVDQWQRFARRELKLYLEDPTRLKFVNTEASVSLPRIRLFGCQNPLSDQLRSIVQSTRVGECIGTDELKEIYKSQREDALTSSKLGHIVSCASCLDEVNQILSLPSLHERYKHGLTRDNRKPPDGSGGGSSDGPTDGPINFSTKLRERLEEVVHHKPKELRVSVNGTVVGSISVGAESSELVLNLPPEEEIDFVEVHGDERILLLFFDLAGHFETLDDEWAQIDLSDGRIITVYLSENSDDKKLRVSYEVPALDEASDEDLLTHAQVKARPTYGLARLGEAISNLNITGWWLKPTLAMLLLLPLITAASFLLESKPTVSQIIDESRLHEDSSAVTDQQITYQVVEIEEVNNVGDVIAVSKLETWHDRLSNRETRLVYDNTQLLIRGSWQQRDGSTVVYDHGSKLIHKETNAPAFDMNPWLLELSTKQFQSLIGDTGKNIQVQQSSSNYIIRWHAGQTETLVGNSRLLTATLTLNRPDLHAVALSLTFGRDDKTTEYRLIEKTTQSFRAEDVSPEVFNPESTRDLTTTRNNNARVSNEALPKPTVTSNVASTELEIEVAYILDKAKEDRNEQITLRRMADGHLLLDGVVETKERKEELLRSLSPVRTNALVRIHLLAVAELRPNQSASRIKTFTQVSENTPNQIPVDQDLRKYFKNAKEETDIDEAIHDLSSSLVNRAYRALFQAIELKRLINRFANTDLQTVAPDARAKWLQLIHDHANAFGNETRELRSLLKPLFFPRALEISSEDHARISDSRELDRAIEQLYRLALNNNETIRAAFTISTTRSGAAVKGDDFWQALLKAEQIALRIKSYGG